MSSIADQTPYNEYTGNGVATAYGFEFQILAESQLVVKVDGDVVSSADYTVSGVGVQAGGTVTFDTAPADDAAILIYRSTALARTIGYTTNGPFPAQTINKDVNLLWMVLQEIVSGLRVMSRVLRFPFGDTRNAELPAATARANKALIFDAEGDVTVSEDDYEDQLANVTAQAGAAATSASAAAGSASAASGSASAASASASSAASSASTASTQAAASAMSAAAAADSAADAAGDATTGGGASVVNRALNVRPFEELPAPWEDVNLTAPAYPAFDRKVNINTASEDPSQAHYAKDTISIVAGDTIKWNGITLTRFTGLTTYAAGLRDIRASDYALTAGKRYVVSCVVCAPFIKADSSGLAGPYNQFVWMRSPASGSDFGHGAKLVGPRPRRIFTVVEADTTTAWRVLGDPATSLSSTASSTSAMRWLVHAFGLGGTLASGDIYAGGFMIEEAPNQTEKVGIALIGTSIDTSTSGLKHVTSERSWPRWFEGMIGRPVFNGAIGGQTSTQLEARFDTDVAVWGVNAKYCILAANVNDFTTGFSSATYRANWLSMYNKAIAAGMIPVFVTPARRTTYDYANGPADLQAEIDYIKVTYPFVIDRDEVLQDPYDANELNAQYDSDGIHPNYAGLRAFGLAVYHKFRHFFPFDNWPSAYQLTVRDDPGTVNQAIQQFGNPAWLSRLYCSRLDASASVTTYRGAPEATAPILEFYGTQGSAKTFQLPVPMFGNNQQPSRSVNDTRHQIIYNNTSDGFALLVQFYGYDGAGSVAAVGSAISIPNGSAYEVITNGTFAVRVS